MQQQCIERVNHVERISRECFEVRDIDRSPAWSIRTRDCRRRVGGHACIRQRVDGVCASKRGGGRKNAECRSENLRTRHFIMRLVIAEYSRRLEGRLVQGTGEVAASTTHNAVASRCLIK